MRTWVVVGCIALAGCSTTDSAPPGEVAATAPSRPAATTESTATTAPPTSPSTTPGTVASTTATSTSASDGRPEGFETIAARVTDADGGTCDLCLWLAETPRQRARGLMFATDLGPAAGMAFRYEAPHTGTFWMKDTVLPLSIAFFGPDGGYVTEFDMEPCTTPNCPRYGTPRGFLVAVETVQGDLPGLGIGPGSSLELLDAPCG